ncbi:MAG: hypothetical protein GX823_06560 [Clostridiales bacterium]|nr:hypothetical protein [Clostridiales bacterium]
MDKNIKPRISPKKTVAIYSVALFIIVVVFIAISYLINQRGENKVEALSEQQTTALQRIDTLRSENERLQSELDESRARALELEAELKKAHIKWAEDSARVEERSEADFNDLLQEFNSLLAQLEADGEETE